MPQTEICARALANPRQQGLPACRPLGDAGGNRVENNFRTAPLSIPPGKFFPDWQNLPWPKKCTAARVGAASCRDGIVAGAYSVLAARLRRLDRLHRSEATPSKATLH